MTTSTSMMGGLVRRKEDPALIRGRGLYTDDVKLPGQLTAAFVRSPFAKARITSIDADEAQAMPGVHAIYTIDDVRHLGPLLAQVAVGAARPLLADGTVHHMGEAVVMVVADDGYIAQDAVDSIFVDYDPLDAAIDLKDAASDRVLANDALESNTLLSWIGHEWWPDVINVDDPRPAIEAAKARDDSVVVSMEMTNQRLIPTAIEPRSVVASWNEGYGRFEVY